MGVSGDHGSCSGQGHDLHVSACQIISETVPARRTSIESHSSGAAGSTGSRSTALSTSHDATDALIPTGNGRLGKATFSASTSTSSQRQERCGRKSSATASKSRLVTVALASSGGLLLGYDLGICAALPGNPDFHQCVTGASVWGPPSGGDDPPPSMYCSGMESDSSLGTNVWNTMFGAAAVGALAGSFVSNGLGRRPCMIMAAILCSIGHLLTALASNEPMLYSGRAVTGLGVGLSCQVVPLYLAEISWTEARGVIGMCFQLAITIGIAVGCLLFYLWTTAFDMHLHWTDIGHSHESGEEDDCCSSITWRIAILFGVGIDMLVLLCFALLCDTPQFLASQEDGDRKAFPVLSSLSIVHEDDLMSNYLSMVAPCKEPCSGLQSWKELLSQRKHLPSWLLTVFLAVGGQFTFLNGFLIFLPTYFAMMSMAMDSSQAIATFLGVTVNILSTTVAMFVTDKFGRRPLIIEAGLQMALASLAFFLLSETGVTSVSDGVGGAASSLGCALAVVLTVLYVSAFAWSWGPLSWTVPAEIGQWRTRSAVTSLGAFMICVAAMASFSAFPVLLCVAGHYIYIVTMCIMLTLTTAAWLLLPETQGVPLADMHRVFQKHLLWRQCYPTTASAGPLPK